MVGSICDGSQNLCVEYFAVIFGVCGFVINTISLIYFLKYENQGIGSKLMILLNANDLLLCVASILLDTYRIQLLLLHHKSEVIRLTALASFNILGCSSGWITLNMVVVRCIVIYHPFYHINSRALSLSIVIAIPLIASVLLFVLLKYSTPTFTYMIPPMAITQGVLIFIISGVTLLRLRKQRNILEEMEDRSRRNATYTILIIGCVYFTTSLIILIAFTTTQDTMIYTYLIAVPMSSFINPLVYVCRKRKLRKFVRSPCYSK